MDAVKLLTELVSIPSPSGEESEAARFLVAWMRRHGFDADIDEAGNAVGVRGSGEREILLLGHIDTVSGQLPIHRTGNWLSGRGTVDAKGPLCAFACAAGALAVPADWRVTVVGAVEEESATSRGARFVLEQTKRMPVCCVIGEPSRWDRMTVGYRGRLLMDVDLRAPMAHSAGEQRLPAERAVDIWRAIEEECDRMNRQTEATPVFERVDASLRDIVTRQAGACGTADISVGFRLPPGLSPETMAARMIGVVRRSFDRASQGDMKARGQVPRAMADPSAVGCHFSGKEQAYQGAKNNALVRAFLQAIRSAGGEPRFVRKSGTSDMNVVGAHWPDMPMVAYGPGDSALDHTPDEGLDVTELERAINVLGRVLEKLVGG